MLYTIISFPFVLGVYWLLWKLYLWAAPSIVPDEFPQFVKTPTYLQFAIVLLVISFITKDKKE